MSDAPTPAAASDPTAPQGDPATPPASATTQSPVDSLGEKQLSLQVDVWKTMVSVQQHFNDIGWRIRSLAITALTFTLGATFFGYLNADNATLGNLTTNPAALVPLLGVMIWLFFWFADGVWYHRLLTGAGKAAGPVEATLKQSGIDAGLSTSITEASHSKWLGFESNSTRKLNTFYLCGIAILLLTAIGVVVLSAHQSPKAHESMSTSTSTPTPSFSRTP